MFQQCRSPPELEHHSSGTFRSRLAWRPWGTRCSQGSWPHWSRHSQLLWSHQTGWACRGRAQSLSSMQRYRCSRWRLGEKLEVLWWAFFAWWKVTSCPAKDWSRFSSAFERTIFFLLRHSRFLLSFLSQVLWQKPWGKWWLLWQVHLETHNCHKIRNIR